MSLAKLVVYWDGQCPFCAAMAQRMAKFDTKHALDLVDYNIPEVAKTALPRFSYDHLNTEMHVLMPDGTWRIGYWAWVEVLRLLPAFQVFSSVMSLWIFAEVGPQFYRWFANHRLEISKILDLPAPCSSDGACKLPSRAAH